MDTRGSPRKVAIGRARGVAYEELDVELERSLARWIELGRVDEGVELRRGTVWRVGDRVVKLYGPERPFRAARALRAARLAHAARGVIVPRPIVALRWGPSMRARGSLLASAFVAGPTLFEAWSTDDAAVRAFPSFLARLHASNVVHGDLHPENVLWNGVDWVPIDLDSARRRVAVAERGGEPIEHWARVLRALDHAPRARELFAEYAALTGRDAARRDGDWRAIERRARAMPPIPPEQLARIRGLLAPR